MIISFFSLFSLVTLTHPIHTNNMNFYMRLGHL